MLTLFNFDQSIGVFGVFIVLFFGGDWGVVCGRFYIQDIGANLTKKTHFSSTIFIPLSHPCKLKKKRQESLLSQVIKFHKSKTI